MKYSFRVDTTEIPDFIRYENDKIYTVSYENYYTHGAASKEEIFFDFNSREGYEWHFKGLSIFPSGDYIVDSIRYDQSVRDSIYYVSCNESFDVSDDITVQSFVLCRDLGIVSFALDVYFSDKEPYDCLCRLSEKK